MSSGEVILDRLQEARTLELFLLLEKYEGDVVAQYFINVELLNRVKKYEERNKEYGDKLFIVEENLKREKANTNHYIGLYNLVKEENKELLSQRKKDKLSKKLVLLLTGAIIVDIAVNHIN